MNLLINKDKAIKILRDRLAELDDFNFNHKAWKDRTVLDLKEIFPLGSSQWLQVSQISFTTFVTSEKNKVLNGGKATARKLINSYIDFINEYSSVAEERQVIKERDYEQKYVDLLKKWNELVPQYHELLNKYDKQLDDTISIQDQLDERENEINRIKSETIQLDNVSFSKLTKAFFNLQVWQIVTVFSIAIGVFVGAFSIGKVYQENASNNILFDIKSENKELKDNLKKTESILEGKNKEIIQLTDKQREMEKIIESKKKDRTK
jgi:hypothetical protein